MSKFRRVVTGHDAAGQSVIASDESVTGTAVPGMPGVELTTLWGADAPMHYPNQGQLPAFSTWFAPVGGFRLIEFVIGPEPAAGSDEDAPVADPAAVQRLFPGLLDTMDPEVPGMHRSATIDLLYVRSGRVMLELDDGSQTELRAGDVAVQSGTMHAWRNPFTEPCRILGVILGAHLDKPAG
ncbi:MAG: cupin domain-containing protein [Gammaproteobacteria bacterium]